MFSIEDSSWDGQRTPVSDPAGCLVKASEPSEAFAHAELGFGMMSKRDLLKDTFGFEMYAMPSGSAQPIDIAPNMTDLR